MISATSEDQEAWLADQWQRAREYARRTFSNMAVTSPTGVRLLEVTPLTSDPNKSLVAVRDSFGNDLLRNDTVAGWGLASPRNGYTPYPAWPAVQTASTSFIEAWLFGGFCYSKDIEWAYIHGTEFTTTFSECQLEWSPTLGPPWTLIPGSTTQSNQDVSDSTTVWTVRSGTFTLPLAAAGNFFAIRLVLRKASGPGAKAFCTPVYLNAI